LRKLVVLFAVIALVTAGTADARLPFGWGETVAPTFHAVSDTFSLTNAAYDAVVDIAGQSGIVYMIVANADAAHDVYLRITIDGVADSVNYTGAAEELSRYVVPLYGVQNATGVDKAFSLVDSSAAGSAGNLRMDIPFANNFKVEQATTASGLVSTTVLYGVYE